MRTFGEGKDILTVLLMNLLNNSLKIIDFSKEAYDDDCNF